MESEKLGFFAEVWYYHGIKINSIDRAFVSDFILNGQRIVAELINN